MRVASGQNCSRTVQPNAFLAWRSTAGRLKWSGARARTARRYPACHLKYCCPERVRLVPPRTNMLRMALPSSCRCARGSGEPCSVFHRLVRPHLPKRDNAIDGVTRTTFAVCDGQCSAIRRSRSGPGTGRLRARPLRGVRAMTARRSTDRRPAAR
jgi:hypothetical protein